jgi:hypothetical protein
MRRQKQPNKKQNADIFSVIILILCTTSFLDRYCHMYMGAGDENNGF